jgi:hypothetical protein
VLESYQVYLLANYATLQASRQRQFGVSTKPEAVAIRRYTVTNKDELLLTLRDLVGIWLKGVDYRPEAFELGKQLVRELRKHRDDTGQSYPFLTSDAVVFNQLSLQVSLSYENILHHALGFRNPPTSVEAQICYLITPKPFDTFAAPVEFGPNCFKLACSLYGHDAHYAQYGRADKQRRLSPEEEERRGIMRESEGWRCLMVLACLMSGVEHHKTLKDRELTLPEFKQFISEEANRIDGNSSVYDILGPEFLALGTARNL